MKPSAVAKAIEACVAVRRPIFLWGNPGIGKTMLTGSLAASMGRHYFPEIAAYNDAPDVRGFMIIGTNPMEFTRPSIMPTTEEPSILFLDELNRAPAMVQNTLLQLCEERRIGNYRLPDACSIVAAGNPNDSGVQSMGNALGSRFFQIDMEPDLDDWCKWAVSAGVHPLTIAFMRFRPDLLDHYDRKQRVNPSPRAWHHVSDITHLSPGNGIEHSLYAGKVGEGPAVEYSAFLRLFRELPSLDSILLDPSRAPIPTAPGTLFAVASALASRASVSNIGRVITYLDRLPQEYGIFGIQDATRRDSTLTATPEYTQWAIAHSDVTM